MHDHEFEKQVHRKMEDLQIDPSGSVWMKVEDRLHQQKRRRRMLWLPTLFTGLLLFSYFLLPDHLYVLHSPASSHSRSINGRTGERPFADKTVAGNQIRPGKFIHTGRSSFPSVSEREAGGAGPAHKGMPAPYRAATYLTPKPGAVPDAVETAGALQSKGMLQEEAGVKDPAAATVPGIIALNGPVQVHVSLPEGAGSTRLTMKLSKKRSWEWSGSLQVTRVVIKNGSLGQLFSLTAADAALSPLNLSSGGFTSRRSVPLGEAGTGFSAGIDVKTHLSRRLFFSTGLHYTLLATRLADDSVKHLNSYHFIGIPATFQWEVNRGKLPLVAEAGVTISRLLSSNALQYNNALSGYYRNDTLLHCMQVSMQAAVYIRALQRSQHPVMLGPALQYGITTAFHDANNRSNHIFQYGLRLSTVIK